jgi:hypothetical protein
MSIFFYRPTHHTAAGKLQEVIMDELLNEEIIIIQAIEELSYTLPRFNLEKNIAVLFIETMTEFYEILAIKKSLDDIRIILILSERSGEAISAGHKLHPRFISYADSDFKDVAGVLKRMIQQARDRGHYYTEPFFQTGTCETD